MKKLMIGVITAFMLVGCGSNNALKENAGAMAASLKAKTSAAALKTIKGDASKTAVLPTAFAGKFNVTEKETEVNPGHFSDFLTFYDKGIPSDAVFPAIRYMEGRWEYYLDMQDLDTGKVEFNEFGLADVSLNTQKSTVIIGLHPRMAGDGYELYPETDEEVGYEPFEGGFDTNGSLKLLGNNVTMYISSYFAWSGREYVMGEIWYPQEAHWGLFLLTRGQE